MTIIMQHTKLSSGIDVLVSDTDVVTELDDTPLPNATVKHNADGSISVDLNGNGIDDIQPYPPVAKVYVKRATGWQGALGWEAYLLNWAEGEAPNAMAFGIYSGAEATGYLYTTAAMIWYPDEPNPNDPDNPGLWGNICPPGQEPGQADIHFGMLIGSLKYSNFTLFNNFDEMTFQTGGDGA